MLHHPSRGVTRLVVIGAVDNEIWVTRRFVWSIDSRQPDQFTRPKPGVQSFGITLLADRERRIDEHLYEVEPRRNVELTSIAATRPVWADDSHDCNEPLLTTEAGGLGDSPDILATIGRAEPEIAVRALAHFVAVENP